MNIIIILLIVYFILILLTEKYNTYSKNDLINIIIIHNIYSSNIPPKYICNYKFVEKTDTNIIYENNDVIMFGIRGAKLYPPNINDIITCTQLYFGIDNINQSDIYISSINLLKKYKHKKIYLIGHSLGGLVANHIMNTHTDYNFINNNMLSFFDGFQNNKLNPKLNITNFSYDIFTLLSSYKHANSNSKIYNAPIPISMYDSFFYNHNRKYNNNNKIKDINKLNLLFIVILFFLFINK